MFRSLNKNKKEAVFLYLWVWIFTHLGENPQIPFSVFWEKKKYFHNNIPVNI
jgi:hypothetical protein